MSNIINGNNYEIAKNEADKIDIEIINILKDGKNFRVEAGAGSGKTYSLNRVIEWLQVNKLNEYCNRKQNVICITYTNAAVDVIKERLSPNSFILPSTIHSFAWEAIKQYQSTLIEMIKNDENMQANEGDFTEIKEVQYTLGHRYKENGVQYLYHDDVLKLFCKLLDNDKFRRIFSNKYPLILIDEYQDSYKPIIDRFIIYFISSEKGPQFGFFGDSWQTIYQSNKACGEINHENISVIKKVSNFRSAPRIVELLNNIRPDLPQKSAIDSCEGEVIVITCDDYVGERRTDRNFRDDLPSEQLKMRLDNLYNKIKEDTPSDEKIKILMITHKVLAIQQGYERLLDIINDGLRDKEDIFLMFFMNTIEPIFKALSESNMQLLFDTLKKRYPITKKSEKIKWKEFEKSLNEARLKKAIDVLKVVIESNLIPIPPNIEEYYKMYYSVPELVYSSNSTLKEFLELEYEQFLAAINFLHPEAEFSTEHGVKGEEYDNVIFVIGRGWNQYQFDTYIPMLDASNSIPSGREASFERNRNLFYVCCSRPKKRLILFVTIPLIGKFKSFLLNMVGAKNILTYKEFLEKK